MAFGGIAAQFIMFIAAMSLATGLVITMKSQVDSTTSSLTMQQHRLATSLREDIKIEAIKHNSTFNLTWVYIKNIGDTKIDIEKVDVFTDGLMVPRNPGNRTINVQIDTDSVNIGIWDPSETVLILVNETLGSIETHDIRVTTDNGIADKEEFSFN